MGRWSFKAQQFDSVMLFKMGKFYEMFNMVRARPASALHWQAVCPSKAFCLPA